MNIKSILNCVMVASLILLLQITISVPSPALAEAGDETTASSLELIPTIECIGVVASYNGDNNQNNSANLIYRQLPSGDWKTAPEMYADRANRQYRGSIFWLKADTDYEVKVTFTDPDGGHSITATTKTRNNNSPIGTNYYYVDTNNPDASDNNSGTSEDSPFKTIQRAADNVTAGDTVLIKEGTYNERVVITRSGTAGNYITFMPYGSDVVILDGGGTLPNLFYLNGADYIRIKGFTIKNSIGQPGVYLNNSDYVIVEDNEVADCNIGGDPDYGMIQIQNGASNSLIQRNTITVTSGEFPGTCGIAHYKGGQGQVIRDNVITATTGVLRDGAFGGGPEGTVGFINSSDFYNNTVIGAYDDGIQVEGGDVNVRIWNNRITIGPRVTPDDALIGIAVCPVKQGPAYIFRNYIGMQDDYGAEFKLGKAYGRIYIYHNTFYSSTNGNGFTQTNYYLGNIVSRNNIVHAGRYVFEIQSKAPEGLEYDFDYDSIYSTNYDGRMPPIFAKWEGAGYNYLSTFQSATGQELHAISFADSRFADPANGDLTLLPDSPCIDQGIPLLGFNDENSPWPYNGPAPDIGAYETPPIEEYEPPYTDGWAPAKGETNVNPNTNIVVHVKDDGAGVNQSTIVMTVEGTPVTPTITGSRPDYTLTYDPPVDFSANQTVNVTVDAQDAAATPNFVSDSYSFTIITDAGNIPEFTPPIGDQEVDEGELLSFTVNATDADSDNLTYSASNLPSGASFNTETHVFSWTPLFHQASSYTDVHFEVTDGMNSVYEDITITVTNVNQPPLADAGPDQDIDMFVTNQVTLDGSASYDPDNDPITYAWTQTSGPAVTLSNTTVAKPTFTLTETGTYSFLLVVNDGTLDSVAPDSVTITVHKWPYVPFRVNCGWLEYQDASGNIWKPDRYYVSGSGYWGVVGGDTATQSADLAISGTDDDPIYRTERYNLSSYKFDLGNGTYDINLHFVEAHHNGAGIRVFDVSIEGQQVLDNLDIYAEVGKNTALIKTFNNVSVIDGQLTIEFTQVVQNPMINGIEIFYAVPNSPPELDSIGDRSVNEGSLLEFSISASDPDLDTLTYSASNTPSGAGFNPSTKTFSWTPGSSQAGTYEDVKFTVSDGSLTDSENITITVNNVNSPPELDSIGDRSVNEGSLLEFSISASDPDLDTLTYSASNTPSGASFNPSTKTLSWTPGSGQAGTYEDVKFTVSDGSLTDSENITITVNDVIPPDDGGDDGGDDVSDGGSGGGGGGGGGGGSNGYTNVAYSVTSTGRFIEDITAESVDCKVELDIPKNTIGTNRNGQPLTNISVKERKPPPDPPEYAEIVGLVYEIGPSGTTFDPAIDLTFEYDDDEVPQGVAEKNLVVSTYDWDTEQWQDMESMVDVQNNNVTTKSSHFSTYAILAYTRPASFEVTEISLALEEVDFGEAISVSALVTNTGDITGDYEVSLMLDDVVIQTSEITLDGGDSETISFSYIPEIWGEHTVGLGDWLATCVVREPEIPAAFTVSEFTMTPAEVNLGESLEISILVTNTGDLPGSYDAILMMDDTVMQNQGITLNGGDSVTVSFSVTPESIGEHTVVIDNLQAVFVVKALPPSVTPEISGFNVTPIYDAETGKLISARIDYQLSAVEELTPEAELILKVFFEGEPLEEIPLLDLGQWHTDLNTGSLGYIPSLGWNIGLYTFQAELYEDDSSVQSTEQRQFSVTPESVTKVVSWKTLGVVIGSMVIVIILTVALVLYRRRDMLRDYME